MESTGRDLMRAVELEGAESGDEATQDRCRL
jgi:hypothetical protein